MSFPTDDLDAPGRWGRKHRAILAAATHVFLSKGYLGTSMDEVAAVARVSKQTVYKHFVDKESLFIEIVRRTVDEISDPVHAEVLELPTGGDLEADLVDLARRLLTRVVQPRLIDLRRLVIGEAARFPELGQTFYEHGVGRTTAALAEVFEKLGAAGELAIGDPALAAGQFNWLVMSAPINRAMFLATAGLPTRAELERHAEAAVGTFLAAYRPR